MATGGRAAADLNELGAASVDYLMYSGYAALAYFWARMALTATQLLAANGGADPFLTGKVATAQFYVARMLPRAEAHKRSLEAGAGVLMQIDAARVRSCLRSAASMPEYVAPRRDMEFVLFDLLDAQSTWQRIPALADVSRDLVTAVLEEAGKIASEPVQTMWHSSSVACAFVQRIVQALDGANQVMFVGCEANATMVTVDLSDRTVVDRHGVGETPDVLAYDPGAGRVYVAAESGWVSIFDHEHGRLTARGSAHLADGAHSMALDPTTHHSYFPIPKGPNGSPVLWEFEPAN